MKLLTGFALLALLSSAQAQDSVTIPKLTEAVTVDGDLSDWPKTAPITVDSSMTADATAVSDDGDLSMNAYTGFDDTTFYLGAEVTDDVLVFERSGDELADNDAVGVLAERQSVRRGARRGPAGVASVAFFGDEKRLVGG